MSGKPENKHPETADSAPKRTLAPAAERALAEAQARRAKAQAQADALPKEKGGRGGQDPARYGDWEINGRAIDF